MYERHGEKANFKLVYIEEAHANDEWPVGSKLYDYPQAKTLEQRQQAAKDMRDDLGVKLPIVLDSVDNLFSKDYCPWPFRFYVLHKGNLICKPQPIGGTYDIVELWELLEPHHGLNE